MNLTNYPLPILHSYTMDPARVGRIQTWLARVGKPQIRELQDISGSRVASLPDAADLLAGVTSRLRSSQLIVSAFGLREGLLYEDLSRHIAIQDPLLVAARVEGDSQGRFVGHGDAIERWIAPLFADDDERWRRIRFAACLLADVGWRANPDFRAERGLEIALHGNWVGIDAQERAVLGQALSANFGGGPHVAPMLEQLAPVERLARAVHWGLAMRLCQRLSGGVAEPLSRSSLSVSGRHDYIAA